MTVFRTARGEGFLQPCNWLMRKLQPAIIISFLMHCAMLFFLKASQRFFSVVMNGHYRIASGTVIYDRPEDM